MTEKMLRDVEDAAERCHRLIQDGNKANGQYLLMRHEVGGEVDRLLRNHAKALPDLGAKLGLETAWLYALRSFFLGYTKAELEELIAARPPDAPPSLSDLMRLLKVTDKPERMKLALLPPKRRSPNPELTRKRGATLPSSEGSTGRVRRPHLDHDPEKMRNLRSLIEADERAANSRGSLARRVKAPSAVPLRTDAGTGDVVVPDATNDADFEPEGIAKRIGDNLHLARKALAAARSELENIADHDDLVCALGEPADALHQEAGAFAEDVREFMSAAPVNGFEEDAGDYEGPAVPFSSALENPSTSI